MQLFFMFLVLIAINLDNAFPALKSGITLHSYSKFQFSNLKAKDRLAGVASDYDYTSAGWDSLGSSSVPSSSVSTNVVIGAGIVFIGLLILQFGKFYVSILFAVSVYKVLSKNIKKDVNSSVASPVMQTTVNEPSTIKKLPSEISEIVAKDTSENTKFVTQTDTDMNVYNEFDEESYASLITQFKEEDMARNLEKKNSKAEQLRDEMNIKLIRLKQKQPYISRRLESVKEKLKHHSDTLLKAKIKLDDLKESARLLDEEVASNSSRYNMSFSNQNMTLSAKSSE